MRKTRVIAFIVPLIIAFSAFAAGTVAYADSGRGGGRESFRSSGGRGSDVVARQGGRDVVTRSVDRGGYVGRGGYSGRGGYGGYSRYVAPRHSHSHFSGSVWFGPGWGFWDPFWYPYYPSYRYYAPPTVVVPQEPQEYVLPETQQEENAYWYYCRDPQGYYPYVERCPSGWMKVVPDTTPPDEPDEQDKENTK